MTRNSNEIFITEEEAKTCKIDDKVFPSSKLMLWYVRKKYNLGFEHYILQTYYNNIRPVCLKTGSPLTFKASKLGPFFHNYSRNSFPRNPHSVETKQKIKRGCEKTSLKKFGTINVFTTDWCKKKMRNTCLKKYGVDNPSKHPSVKRKALLQYYETIKRKPLKKYLAGEIDPNRPSSLEIDFRNKLTKNGIHFQSPFQYEGRKYDFYIKSLGIVIEIDGSGHHKNTLENLTLQTINGSVNDYRKNRFMEDSVYKFYRIRYNPLTFEFTTEESLKQQVILNSYIPDYSLKYKQKIANKEYFFHYIDRKGREKLQSYSHHLLKFIRTFQPEFPHPDLEENLGDVINKISKMDTSKLYTSSTKEFSNNISTVGHNYLKHHFKSYWKSKFNGNKSPVEAWQDDKIMDEVIDYRIGCNDSNEIFDFSLHQMVRGLSARRITISFFKPLLAAGIYYHYLGNNEAPIVLDPCCGFGGRLLGFKSKYPNGTYVGCEPNIETYQELIKLVADSGWKNIELHNCKFEDFKNEEKRSFDLIFTSIPYYDLEKYSNVVNYNSFEEWRNTFITAIESYAGKNCYINLPEELRIKLGWNTVDTTIVSNRSHFDKKDGKKYEPIVCL